MSNAPKLYISVPKPWRSSHAFINKPKNCEGDPKGKLQKLQPQDADIIPMVVSWIGGPGMPI